MRKLAAITALVLALAACGGGGDDAADPASDSSPADTATADTAMTDTTVSDTTVVTTTLPPPGAGSPYCTTVAEVLDDFRAIADAPAGAVSDPAAVEVLFTNVRSALEAMEAAAPDEVSDDFAVLNEAYGNSFDALEAGGWDVMAVSADPATSAQLDAMNSEEVNSAATAIETFTLDSCGIALDGGS